MDDAELYRAALAGTFAFARIAARGSPGGEIHELEGVTAAVVPATPERSLLNCVWYQETAALESALPELAELYGSRGVHAWTVWTPRRDTRAAGLLEAAGHVLDGSPVTMGKTLNGVARPALEDWQRDAPAALLAELNDLAYGYDGSFARALAGLAPDAIRVYSAHHRGAPASVLAIVDVGADAHVTLVATLPDARGRGLARGLLGHALADAAERGLESSSLVATKAGAGVYEQIGFRALGPVDMWERRGPAPA